MKEERKEKQPLIKNFKWTCIPAGETLNHTITEALQATIGEPACLWAGLDRKSNGKGYDHSQKTRDSD